MDPSKFLPNVTATHHWDCNGASCDATTLQPFVEDRYSYAAAYGPLSPPAGAAAYGEELWLVGAASDALSALLGPDVPSCGRDDTGHGGCGRCLLVRNPTALRADLLAVVM